MPYENEDEQSRKLFIGRISYETTDDGLREYFSKYGKITDCVVIREKGTNKSKGFGFVTFETEEEADRCMKPEERPHTIDGRTIDAKRAVSREESSKPGAHIQVKKVFVGGVKQGCDESMLKAYFSKFGNIVSVEIPLHKETQQPKGFGFVTFDDFDVADKLVAKRNHDIFGFHCQVKKALSRDEIQKAKEQLEMKDQQQQIGDFRSGGYRDHIQDRRQRRSRNDDGYGHYNSYVDGDVGSYGGGPMRRQYDRSERSTGPYGYGVHARQRDLFQGKEYGESDYNSRYSGEERTYSQERYGNTYNSGNSNYGSYNSNDNFDGYGKQRSSYYGSANRNY